MCVENFYQRFHARTRGSDDFFNAVAIYITDGHRHATTEIFVVGEKTWVNQKAILVENPDLRPAFFWCRDNFFVAVVVQVGRDEINAVFEFRAVRVGRVGQLALDIIYGEPAFGGDNGCRVWRYIYITAATVLAEVAEKAVAFDMAFTVENAGERADAKNRAA